MIILRKPGSSTSASSTFIGLTDTPSYYDEDKFLKSTAIGTEWTTLSGIQDHSLLSNLDYDSSGHTGFASQNDLITVSGVLQNDIDQKSDIGHTHVSSGSCDGITKDGLVAISNGNTNVSVTFDEAFSELNYAISLGLQNIVDSTISVYPTIITNKTLSGFTVEFSGDIDSDNYYLNWIATISGGCDTSEISWQSGNAVVASGTNNVDVVFPATFDDSFYVITFSLQNNVDSTASIYPAIIKNKQTTGFSLEFSGYLDSDNYSISWIATTSGTTTPVSGNYLSEVVEDPTPTLGGDLDVSNFGMSLDTTPSGNFIHGYTIGYSGDISTMYIDRNDNGVGTPFYMKSNGKWHQCTAASGTTQMPCSAIAIEEGEGMRKIMWKGILRKGAWSWTPGDLIYVSTVEAALTSAEPNGGAWSQCVGVAISSDTIRFDPGFYPGYINS